MIFRNLPILCPPKKLCLTLHHQHIYHAWSISRSPHWHMLCQNPWFSVDIPLTFTLQFEGILSGCWNPPVQHVLFNNGVLISYTHTHTYIYIWSKCLDGFCGLHIFALLFNFGVFLQHLIIFVLPLWVLPQCRILPAQIRRDACVLWGSQSSKSSGGTSDNALGCWRSSSGELTFCHGKSPCLMGKSTINGHFQLLFVCSPEGNHLV